MKNITSIRGMRRLLTPSIAQYKKRYLKHDLIAALTVTAIAIPESLGFAAIVGLPPVTGLYTALLAPIVFGLFASTRRLVVGADSATAALLASGAVLVAQAGSAGYANAIGVIGLLTAAILVLMACFKLGFLADLISRPVLVGFLAGVGVQLIITRFPEMLGLHASGSLWQQLLTIFEHVGSINFLAVTIAILVIGMILVTRRSVIPGELIGIALATLFVIVFHLDQHGVERVGALTGGFPEFSVPSLSLGAIVTLLPIAASIALVILAQSSSVIRSLGGEHDDATRLNQDLLALGVANAASALTHGFSVNGSPPRSYAADTVGAKSQLVNIVMGLLIGALLLVGTGLFTYMPTAALAAIVFMLGFRLIRFQELRRIWSTHRMEFVVALIALLGTAIFGVRQGIFIAVIVSLMERLSRQYHPKDDVLLRDGVLSDWAKERLGSHAAKSKLPDSLLVYRFDGSLFFENIEYFIARLRRAIDTAKCPVHQVIVDAGAIDTIDYTAVEQLKSLYRYLDADTISLGFAHVSPSLAREFDAYGVTDLVGKKNIFSTLTSALEHAATPRENIISSLNKLSLGPEDYVLVGSAVLEALHLRRANDIDIVVRDEVYERLRDEKHWKEFTLPSGRHVLSRDDYNVMRNWMGLSYARLQKNAWTADGLVLMHVAELINKKRQLARRKDDADIALLRDYLRRHDGRESS